jgi:transcriptional regulator of acetoin/glycerol metabolism
MKESTQDRSWTRDPGGGGSMKSYLESYLEAAREGPPLPTLKDLEKDYIGYLLELTGHNVTLASKILAISRTAVYHKMAKYGISKPN